METLFPGEWRGEAQCQPPVILTPLGAFVLRLDPVVSAEHQEFRNLRGDCLLIWSATNSRAELLIRSIEPQVPQGMRIDGCLAAVWRLHVFAGEFREYIFRCDATHQLSAFYQGGCSGEFLESKEWSDGSTTIALGTQDADAMIRVPGCLFPARWLAEEWGTSDVHNIELIRYAPQGFHIRPPALYRGETVQVQFVIAWASEPHSDASTACWFAVDPSPAQILKPVA